MSSTLSPQVKNFDHLPDSAGISIRDAASLGDISVPTVYRLIKKGMLPKPMKIGNSSRFRVGDLRAAFAAKS